MSQFLDIKFFISIAHHAETFISSATSPLDIAAYYCDTNFVLLDDKGRKRPWVEKISNMRRKQCIAVNSRTQEDSKQVIEFIENIQKPASKATNITRKLNIGGTEAAKGWEILNGQAADYVDYVGDASDLSLFEDHTFNTIYSSHTLEHISYWNHLIPTLKEWRRVLKDDGEILISVPNLDVLCKEYCNETTTKKQRYNIMRIMYGGQYNDYDYHYAGFNIDIMAHFARHSGLMIEKQVEEFNLFKDVSSSRINGKLLSLNVVLKKTDL